MLETKLITDFIRLNIAHELIKLKTYPNAKEITEAMGLWRFIEKTLIIQS